MRVKPASSINPKQFWTAVDEYMRPLPKQPPPTVARAAASAGAHSDHRPSSP